MKYLTNLDINKNELQNARIQNLATAPQNPVEGQIYYNTVDKAICQWNGTEWNTVGSDAPIQKINVNGIEITPDANKAVDITALRANFETTTTERSMNLQQTESSGGTSGVKFSVPQNSPGADDLVDILGTFNRDNNNPGIIIDKQLVTKSYADGKFRTEAQVQDAIDAALSDYLELAGGIMEGNIDMGANKITGLVDPTVDSDAATKGYVDAKVVGAFEPAGSYAFADLPALSANTLHKMYNITDAFTATSDFVDNEVGNEYPAGTNVAVINAGTTSAPVYKYDALTGVIDTSSFATKTDVNGMITEVTGSILASGTDTSKTLTYTGTLIEAYALMGGERVIVDIAQASGSTKTVTFSVAAVPQSDVQCVVVSKTDLT